MPSTATTTTTTMTMKSAIADPNNSGHQRLDRIRRLQAERKVAKDASNHRKQLIGNSISGYLNDADDADDQQDNTAHVLSSSYDMPALQALEDASSSQSSTNPSPPPLASSKPDDADGTLDRLLNKLNTKSPGKNSTTSNSNSNSNNNSERRSRSSSLHQHNLQLHQQLQQQRLASASSSVHSRRRSSMASKSEASEHSAPTRTARPSALATSDSNNFQKPRSRSTGPLDGYMGRTATSASNNNNYNYNTASLSATTHRRRQTYDGDSVVSSVVGSVATAPNMGRVEKELQSKKSSKSLKKKSKNKSSLKKQTDTNDDTGTAVTAVTAPTVLPSASRHTRSATKSRHTRSVDIALSLSPNSSHNNTTTTNNTTTNNTNNNSKRKSSMRKSRSVDTALENSMSPSTRRGPRTVMPTTTMSMDDTMPLAPLSPAMPSSPSVRGSRHTKKMAARRSTSVDAVTMSMTGVPIASTHSRPDAKPSSKRSSSAHQQRSRSKSMLDDAKSKRKSRSVVVDKSPRKPKSSKEKSKRATRTIDDDETTKNKKKASRRKSESVVTRPGRSVERPSPAAAQTQQQKPRAQSLMPLPRHSDESIRKIDYSVLKENFLAAGHFANNAVLVNTERNKHGLPSLQRNLQLDALACDIAQRMAMRRQHEIVITHAGNMKRGPTIRVIHAAMMENESERTNILSASVNEFGMGTAKGGDGLLYLCQLFAQTRVLVCSDL